MFSVRNPRNSRAIQAPINGSNSHGPVTNKGKQISSHNAVKHGFFSPQVVLRNENYEEFDALLLTLTNEHNPESESQCQLVNIMAAAQWRIHRVQRIETALLEGTMEHNRAEFDSHSHEGAEDDDDEAHRIADAWRDLMGDDRFDKLAQHEARFQRQYTRALTALLKLQKSRRPSNAQPDNPSTPAHSKNQRNEPKPNPAPTPKNQQNEPSKSLKTNNRRLDAA